MRLLDCDIVLELFLLSRDSVEPMTFDGPAGILMPGGGGASVDATADDISYPSTFFVNVQEPLKR